MPAYTIFAIILASQLAANSFVNADETNAEIFRQMAKSLIEKKVEMTHLIADYETRLGDDLGMWKRGSSPRSEVGSSTAGVGSQSAAQGKEVGKEPTRRRKPKATFGELVPNIIHFKELWRWLDTFVVEANTRPIDMNRVEELRAITLQKLKLLWMEKDQLNTFWNLIELLRRDEMIDGKTMDQNRVRLEFRTKINMLIGQMVDIADYTVKISPKFDRLSEQFTQIEAILEKLVPKEMEHSPRMRNYNKFLLEIQLYKGVCKAAKQLHRKIIPLNSFLGDYQQEQIWMEGNGEHLNRAIIAYEIYRNYIRGYLAKLPELDNAIEHRLQEFDAGQKSDKFEREELEQKRNAEDNGTVSELDRMKLLAEDAVSKVLWIYNKMDKLLNFRHIYSESVPGARGGHELNVRFWRELINNIQRCLKTANKTIAEIKWEKINEQKKYEG